jgi:hypothetical protein
MTNLCSFEISFNFVEADVASATDAISGPDGSTREQMLQWLADLPSKQSPVWLGLPFHAERVLLATRAHQLTVSVLKLQVSPILSIIISSFKVIIIDAGGGRRPGVCRPDADVTGGTGLDARFECAGCPMDRRATRCHSRR